MTPRDYSWILQPNHPRGEPIALVWNLDTGKHSCGKYLEGLVTAQLEYGKVAILPPPQNIPFDDPWNKPGQLVALLAHFWELPPELMKEYPQPEVTTKVVEGVVY